VPSVVNAAELYLETSQPEYAPNETFIADIRLNVTPPESINAIEAYLEFPKNILKVVDFSTGNSILTFIEEPKINQEKGLISFVGIIPGGYSGRLLGDPGKSNLLGRIVLRTIRETTQNGTRNYAKIEFLDNSQALLSDGKGTPAELITKGVIVEIVTKPFDYAQGRDEWQEELEKDKIPPEDFIPEIIKIDNKYYLAFNSQDKQSGIAYYAIHETTRKKETTRINTKGWVEAESPYVLKDQKLRSYIYVKAIDKAGNERIVELPATYPLPWYKNYYLWCIIILASIIVYYISRILWTRCKIKHDGLKSLKSRSF